MIKSNKPRSYREGRRGAGGEEGSGVPHLANRAGRKGPGRAAASAAAARFDAARRRARPAGPRPGPPG